MTGMGTAGLVGFGIFLENRLKYIKILGVLHNIFEG